MMMLDDREECIMQLADCRQTAICNRLLNLVSLLLVSKSVEITRAITLPCAIFYLFMSSRGEPGSRHRPRRLR